MTTKLEESRDLLLNRAKEGLIALEIPEHMHGGILRYLEHGIEPGSFLLSVLSNDLKGTISRADATNKRCLENYVHFCSGYLPSVCWGSIYNVDDWIKAGGCLGKLKEVLPNEQV